MPIVTIHPFMVYALIDPISHEVRYIGQTNGLNKRLYMHKKIAYKFFHGKYKFSALKNEWLLGLYNANLSPNVIILERTTREKINEAEERWIKLFSRKGANLLNFANNY
jgi:hypothetical protein